MNDRIDDTAPTQRSPGDWIVIALFAALLITPLVLAATGRAGFDAAFIERTELRRPFAAPPPSTGALATGGWERDAERELADAFPLRSGLIDGYHDAKYVVLGDLGTSHVIKGRGGWLFLADEERRYLEGDYQLGDADLARAADIYKARADWCAKHGAAYLFLIAPNKSTVYPDELGGAVARVAPTPADRFVPLLKARGVNVVDVRAELRRAAESAGGSELAEVYSKGDSHWNDSGAYIAYRAMVDALRGAGVRDRIDRGSLNPRAELGEGDLLRLAGIASIVKNRVVRLDFPKRAHPVALPAYPDDPKAASLLIGAATAVDDPSLPAAVLFGDSFLYGPLPFLAEDFRRMVGLGVVDVTAVQFDEHVVEVEKPNVVIQEIVERNLIFAGAFKP